MRTSPRSRQVILSPIFSHSLVHLSVTNPMRSARTCLVVGGTLLCSIPYLIGLWFRIPHTYLFRRMKDRIRKRMDCAGISAAADRCTEGNNMFRKDNVTMSIDSCGKLFCSPKLTVPRTVPLTVPRHHQYVYYSVRRGRLRGTSTQHFHSAVGRVKISTVRKQRTTEHMCKK